jgi:MarR family transcriptional regulator, organic hydroperoxide resistance regulator
MRAPELLLSNQLCFLVHRLDLAIAAKYRPILSELGLTYTQYLAMLALWEHGELGIGELCELLHLDTGTVSPLAKRLESAGLVNRVRGSEDERSVAVSLSAAGRALRAKASKVPAALAPCLDMDESDFTSLRASLEKVLARVEGGDLRINR